jgi:hypothetical protein
MTHPSWGTEWQAATLPKEAPDEIEAQRTMRRLKRRRRLILRGSLLTVGRPLAVVIAGMAWVGVDGLHARGELKIAATQVHVQEGQVVKGDRKAAAATLKSLQTYAASAREDTHGPHWSAARASTCCWRRTQRNNARRAVSPARSSCCVRPTAR